MPYEDYYASKPWEDTTDRFGIRDNILNRAIKNRALLRIFYEGKVAIHDPKRWMKTGERIFRIWKYPDDPMRLFVNTARFIEPETEEDKLRQLSQQCL